MNDEVKNESGECNTEISLNDEKRIDIPIEILLNNETNVVASSQNEISQKDVVMEDVKIVGHESACAHCNIL